MRRSDCRLWAGMLTAVCGILMTAGAEGSDWPRFRGPNGSGVSADTGIPTTWSDDSNLKWKLDLPGRGVSSPIVIGDRVFVTCYSGYGMGRDDGGSIEDLKRHLVCVDRNNGEILWNSTVDAIQPEDPYNPPGVTAHGYASHTPVSDGENVYVFFGKSGVLAFDMDGNQLWQQNVGMESGRQRWGSAASPVLFEDLVIVNASDESEAVVALDKKSGEEKWRKEASGLAGSWSTPVIMSSATGPELVLAVDGETWAFDAKKGDFKWYAPGTSGRSGPAHSVIPGDGIVYNIGGGGAAVKPGGKGEIKESDLVWNVQIGGRFATPVLYQGKIYTFTEAGVASYDAASGERVQQLRLASDDASEQPERGGRPQEGGRDRGAQAQRGGGPQGQGGGRGPGGGRGGRGGRGGGFGARDYASPVAADGKLVITKNDGTFIVVRTGDEMEVLATNKLSSDSSGFAGTPAISDGNLFVRSHAALYCIGE